MRDPSRIDRILGRLRAYWSRNPDLRLGQILCNAAQHQAMDPFYMEDDALCLGLPDSPAMGWTSDRPTAGDWYLACDPSKRHLWLRNRVWPLAVTIADGVLSFFGIAFRIDAEIDDLLAGALWLPRTTPADPFAAPVKGGGG